MDCQFIGSGIVSGNELNIRVHEISQKCNISRQPIQFRYDQSRSGQLALIQNPGKLRPVINLSRFDLDEFPNHISAFAVGISHHCITMGFQTQAALFLLCC